MSEQVDRIMRDFEKTKAEFPFIEKKYSMYQGYLRFEGWLIPKEFLERMDLKNLEKAKPYSLHVSIYVPISNYLTRGPIVYDYDEAIDWSIHKDKDVHYNSDPIFKYSGKELCTHVLEETKRMGNPFYEVVKSAYCLYSNYLNIKAGGKPLYHGYSHGDQGIKESRIRYGNK